MKHFTKIFLLVVVLLSFINAHSQTKETISGIVVDEFGSGLPGVNVIEKGTSNGTTTNVDGKFTITVNDGEKSILSFTFLGMKSIDYKLSGRNNLKIEMKEDMADLEEVVLVAFGKQKKESLVSAITTIKPAELQTGSGNLTASLGGAVAGMISYQSSGEPGQDDASFFIRGVTTFGSGKVDPLILIDGIEMTTADLSRLHPDDIANFSVMKDAAATALYGSRGANGVLLINTKEGKKGKTKIDVRLETSISAPTRQVEFADPITYMELHNEAMTVRDPLAGRMYSLEKIERTRQGLNSEMYPATDWYDMLFKDYTVNTKGNISFSGGGDKYNFYVAGSYAQNNGVLKVDELNDFNSNIDLKKYTLRSNVNFDLSKTTKMKVRFYGAFDDYTGPLDGGGAIYSKVVNTNPVLFPAYYPAQGEYGEKHIAFGNYGNGGFNNPYADMVKGYKEYQTSTLSAQVQIEQDLALITKGLKFRVMGNTIRSANTTQNRSYKPFFYTANSYDYLNDSYTLTPINPESGSTVLTYKRGAQSVKSSMYLETALNWNRKFGKHSTSAMLIGIANERIISNTADGDSDLQSSMPFRNLGLSGRFSYGYDKKYMVEANFGYNGSERFSEEERFGFFPSGAVGWIVSNEDWYGDLKKTITRLKFRASYGISGNDQIGTGSDRFFYMSNANLQDGGRKYTFGEEHNGYSQNGISISRYANPNITWETAEILNVGVEMDLFKDLSIQLEAFKQNRSNILMTRSYVPSTLGLEAQLKTNTGKAKSEGVDLSMNYNRSFGDWWATARVNFTYAVGTYVLVDEPVYDDTPWKRKTRQKINQVYGYIAERLFIDEADVYNSPSQSDIAGDKSYGAGDIKYRDINNDGKISDLDKVPIGNPTSPEINYGFGFSVGYKKLDVSAFFSGVGNRSFWVDAQKITPFKNDQGALLKVIADSHWSENRRDLYSFWPKLSTYAVPNNTVKSTWYMQDGSLLRLKRVEFGYKFSNNLVNKLHLRGLRLYGSADNLVTWSNFNLWDVEMGANGLGYPIQQTFNLGLQVGL